MADTFFELQKSAKENDLAEHILKTQSLELSISTDELYLKVETIADSMIQTIKKGLESTELSSSGLSGDSTSILKLSEPSKLVNSFNKKVMTYALATIEENARMGKIAACPTAGSSGIVPAVLVSAYEDFNKDKSELVKALIVAGEIGRLIAIKMPLAGAVAGCQAECGAASAMASASLTYMLHGEIETIFNSAALCLKNVLGLTCDPVAGLVEVPCVKRNIFMAELAVNSSYLAMSGIKSVIPLDDVVDAMKETGMLMSPKLKESSEAGLATTKKGTSIRDELYAVWHKN